ncbi:MAG: ATP-dependent sacrificial sulfur transferase LarE [Bacteroidales bacterium]|nr:ATP-dependent sacrificial sulfur transferase LarE [Bacteroidales bacterium]
MDKAKELANKLEAWYIKTDKVVIALSGGIDSSLVTYSARKILGKQNAIAVISASASVKQRELDDARKFCMKYDILLDEVDAGEIEDTNYTSNPINRCYYCKSALYIKLEELISEKYKGYYVLNGNNFSDFSDYRPGLEAAAIHKVYSPLAECQFNKEDIRLVSRYYGLTNWNKPASPCLSSRFPYRENITREKLHMVEMAENFISDKGFSDVRVRISKGSARIEVPSEEIDDLRDIFPEVSASIINFGFNSCEIDTEGLISGKLNRTIEKDGLNKKVG